MPDAMTMASQFALALRELSTAIAVRLLCSPLRLVVPRSGRIVTVIGREHGKFLDNAKHFFCWLHASAPADVQATFISEHAGVVSALRDAGARALEYPTASSIWTLLRSGTVVVDSVDFVEHGRIALVSGARIVQLWHGAPLKEIELPLYRRRLARLSRLKRLPLQVLKAATGRFLEADMLVSTSGFFTEHAFSKCFNARRILAAGYPRNDAMLNDGDRPAALSMINVDIAARERLRAHRARGGRVILYAPTFRQDRHSPFQRGGIDLERWASVAESRGALLALKLHPLMSGRYPQPPPGIVDISAESDAYPLLSEVDVLVTDYSSIYFDFLLLDRPILFFAYDFDRYTSEDRALLFDYDDMTPGPKLKDFEDLLDGTRQALEAENGEWTAMRHRIRGLCFDNVDASASERIWRELSSNPA